MGKPIRILIVEDSEDDTALLLREIRLGGYDSESERVDTPEAMKEAIKKKKWDAIICDYAMPKFGMPEALKILQKSEHDLPFILVSGTIGEEVAVEAMKSGAHDYIMKDRLKRLVPAIEREIREAGKRQQTRQADNAIQTLVKSTVGTTGQDFFDNVVRRMCEWLGTDCTLIGQILDGDNVKALSMQLDGEIILEKCYKLSGTPCGNVAENGYSFYPEGVCKLFPDATVLAEMEAEGYVGTTLRDKNGKPIGILCSISRHKLNLPPRTAEVMDIIAAKASSEIERMYVEKQIKESLKEKEVLLKEIHHRVKNNLQVISSLLNLQSKYIGDEEVLSIFRESQNRVKSMSLVHEELYHSKDLARIDFAEYVRSLVNNLFRSYGTNSCDIIPKIDVVNVFLDVNTAIPCGLIINELVSNSLKYAFPSIPVQDRNESKKGEIKISLHKISDSGYQNTELKSEIRNPKSEITELIVNDNGMGIPEDIDFRDTKSLGLQLVNTLTSQIDGTIELNRKNGTEFRIRFEK